MTLELRTSVDAASRLAAAARWVAGRPAGPLVVVAPTRAAADGLARRVAGVGRLGLHRLTPGQLALRLAAPALAASGLAPVAGLGVQALCARILVEASVARELTYFAPVSGTPGFPRALAATLGELRRAGISGAALAAAGAPGRDLAVLMTRLEAALDEARLADRATVLALAREAVGGAAGSPFVGQPLVLLDVAPESPAEAELLAALGRRAPATLALAPTGAGRALRWLADALEVDPQPLTVPAEAGGTRSLDRVRSRLFTADELQPVPADDSLVLFSAPGEGAECVEIARRIRERAAAGVRFESMAILLRQPQTYQPLVEEALRRGGIPGAFSRGSLRPDRAGRALLVLLECADEGLSASRFAEYLSLGQLPPAPPEEVPWVASSGAVELAPGPGAVLEPVGDAATQGDAAPGDDEAPPVVGGSLRAPFAWERLMVDAAVIGGRDRWVRRLDGLDRALELELERIDDDRREGVLRRRRQLAGLREFALPLIGRLDALPDRATWGAWLTALADLARVALRRPDAVLALLADLAPMAEVGPVGLAEVQRVLAPRLSRLRSPGSGGAAGSVFVGMPSEAAGRVFDVVFLPGLAEGLFPRRAGEDPLLLDVHRAALSARLAVRDDRAHDERALLQLAVGAARERLVVSFPRVDVVAGRSRVPSFYALDLLRAAEGRLPDLRSLERRAAAAGGARMGWPAPADPARALDHAEYDLAWLDGLLGRADPPPGVARYLMEVNPHLARSLRQRWMRWGRGWSTADGLCEPGPEARALLERHRLDARSYSPTALQTYAACPYRFLLYAILRLRPREAPAPLEQIDARHRGSLFHQVQFELLSRLRDAGRLPVRADALDAAIRDLDALLDTCAAQFAERLAPAIPRVWAAEMESLRIDLRAWLRRMAHRPDTWVPAHFELAFGMAARDDHDPASRVAPVPIVGGLRLRGSVDLVERDPAGTLRVVDHKTGRPPPAGDVRIGGGRLLQPLLYALVVEQLLTGPVTSGSLYYCTQKGGFNELTVPLDPAGRDAIGAVAAEIDTAIGEGRLPTAPDAGACRICDYRSLCGPREEERTERKPTLVGLQALRETP